MADEKVAGIQGRKLLNQQSQPLPKTFSFQLQFADCLVEMHCQYGLQRADHLCGICRESFVPTPNGAWSRHTVDLLRRQPAVQVADRHFDVKD